jgi:undecaprenyl-diphosphatase
MNQIVFYWLYNFAHVSPFVDALIRFCAEDLGYVMILAVGAEIIFSEDTKLAFKNAFAAIGSGAVAWIIADILKNIILTPRPFVVLQKVQPLFSETDSAFPSGHASLFGAVAIALLLQKNPRAWIYFVGSVVIGIARVMAGVHWPGDILFGFILGFVCAFIGTKLSKKFLNYEQETREKSG